MIVVQTEMIYANFNSKLSVLAVLLERKRILQAKTKYELFFAIGSSMGQHGVADFCSDLI